MKLLLGFDGFDSTKGKKVDGNVDGSIRKVKKREYRQYMMPKCIFFIIINFNVNRSYKKFKSNNWRIK